MSNLQNKIVVVVGGTSGIGFGVALAALQGLASTVIVASRNPERVANAVERLKAHKFPGEVRGEVVDASDSKALKAFAERIGAVDHVAWTSGDLAWDLFGGDAADPAAQTGIFAVRFWGPFIIAQNVKFNPGGSLTLTAGLLDLKPQKGMVAPSGANAALEGLTRGLAVDLAPLRVNIVAPGGTETELLSKLPISEEAKQAWFQNILNSLLIKRMAQPSDIAEAYIFLMKCGYITGQRINVDGGALLG